MRCPDCNKFTGLENGEPEINNSAAEVSGASVDVQVDIHHARNCADCSTELKALDMTLEESVALDELNEFKALTPAQQKQVLTAAEDGTLEALLENEGAESEEGGGGRYAKNMISVTYSADLKITVTETEIKLTHHLELVEENAAGSYEEQV